MQVLEVEEHLKCPLVKDRLEADRLRWEHPEGCYLVMFPLPAWRVQPNHH